MRGYFIAREILRPFLKLLFRYKAEGRENIPKAPYIVCANHVAYRDALCVACSLPGAVRFVCKSELRQNPFMRVLLRIANVIYVNRSKADLGFVRQCVGTIKSGVSVCIFPQGTRVHEAPAPEQAQEGLALICSLTKVPVLPVALVYKSRKPRLFTRCRVRIGAPVYPEEYASLGSRAGQARYIFGKVCELTDDGKR